MYIVTPYTHWLHFRHLRQCNSGTSYGEWFVLANLILPVSNSTLTLQCQTDIQFQYSDKNRPNETRTAKIANVELSEIRGKPDRTGYLKHGGRLRCRMLWVRFPFLARIVRADYGNLPEGSGFYSLLEKGRSKRILVFPLRNLSRGKTGKTPYQRRLIQQWTFQADDVNNY